AAVPAGIITAAKLSRPLVYTTTASSRTTTSRMNDTIRQRPPRDHLVGPASGRASRVGRGTGLIGIIGRPPEVLSGQATAGTASSPGTERPAVGAVVGPRLRRATVHVCLGKQSPAEHIDSQGRDELE